MDERYSVSIKGVVLQGRRVVLLENERSEWELPGGRLEPDEQPEQCLKREIREELGLEAEIGQLLTSSLFEVIPGRRVFVVTYQALVVGPLGPLTHSSEHRQARLVALAELSAMALPDPYRRAILQAVDILDRFARN